MRTSKDLRKKMRVIRKAKEKAIKDGWNRKDFFRLLELALEQDYEGCVRMLKNAFDLR